MLRLWAIFSAEPLILELFYLIFPYSPFIPVLWIRKDLFQIRIQLRIWMVMSHFILSMISAIEPCYPVQDLSYWVILSTAETLILSPFYWQEPWSWAHFICKILDYEPIYRQKSWNWAISSAGSPILSLFFRQDVWYWAIHFICRIPDIEPFYRQDVWYWAILSGGCLILSHFSGRMSDIEPFHLQDPFLRLLT